MNVWLVNKFSRIDAGWLLPLGEGSNSRNFQSQGMVKLWWKYFHFNIHGLSTCTCKINKYLIRLLQKSHFPRMNHFWSNNKQSRSKMRKRWYFGWKWRRLVVVLLFLYLLSVQPPDLYFTSQSCEYISFFHALLIYIFHHFYWYLYEKDIGTCTPKTNRLLPSVGRTVEIISLVLDTLW